MSHEYSPRFFDYIETGARTSARAFIGVLAPDLPISSVLDVGCGRGAWLDEWQSAGVADISGVDGAYVDPKTLRIPQAEFMAADLTKPVDLGRRFDLVECLEVGEHLPASAAATLVRSLVAHGDCILFSAAQPGQGGECHVNEQPLEYWRSLFRQEGYVAFDFVRPRVEKMSGVEPWYRYNSLLYLNAAGFARASEAIRDTRVSDDEWLPQGGSWAWHLRRTIVRCLPRGAVTGIAVLKSKLETRRRADHAGS